MNNKKTGVFKFTFFIITLTIYFEAYNLKISLKRHGDAKTHFPKGILSDL